MCGRFTLSVSLELLLTHYEINQISFEYFPRYNVVPGQFITAIISDGTNKRIGQLKWGLIPSWAKDEKMAFKTINAKAETLMEKLAFKIPFMRKRCIIPADGFFEWKKTGNTKQPMRILMKDRGTFSLAGLYDTWISPDGNKISTCTIITTKPNELMADIHDRMPVILRKEDEHIWIDRNQQDVKLLQSLLNPYPADEMFAYPVSQIVGNVKNDVPECIKPLNSNSISQ